MKINRACTKGALGGSPQFLYASRASQTTGLGNGGYIAFNQKVISAGQAISLNTATGVFTLQANQTYHLSCIVPFVSFSASEAYLEVQWYNITASASIGSPGATHPFTRTGVNEGKTCVFEAIITPSVTTTVAARFFNISNASGLYNVSASVKCLVGD